MSQDQILETIQQNQGILQCELSAKTGLPKGTVTNQVLRLVKRKEIKRVATDNSKTYRLYLR